MNAMILESKDVGCARSREISREMRKSAWVRESACVVESVECRNSFDLSCSEECGSEWQ